MRTLGEGDDVGRSNGEWDGDGVDKVTAGIGPVAKSSCTAAAAATYAITHAADAEAAVGARVTVTGAAAADGASRPNGLELL